MSDPFLDSLAAAVATNPQDAELRALYADRLAQAGRRDEAIGQALVVLSKQPTHAGAQRLMAQLSGETASDSGSGEGVGEGTAAAPDSATPDSAVPDAPAPAPDPAHTSESSGRIVGYQPHGQGDGPIYARDDKKRDDQEQNGAGQSSAGQSDPGQSGDAHGVDWHRLEKEIGDSTLPPFIVEPDPDGIELADGNVRLGESQVESVSKQIEEWKEETAPPTESSVETLTLDDVGGLVQVKQRIRETFLDPMANPEIAKAFKKSLRGGLLLYGPPGCGKTYLARAIAGELGAHFISVTLADVLSKWLGESEGNIHKTFQEARHKTPSVLFLDEIDAVGGKRSGQSQHLRSIVNQLLMEMDGIGSDNDGLFVLAATNMPWDVDSALLRPGRFDRMVLVLPPDEPAREAILQLHLNERPIEGIDLGKLVRATEGFSGADLQHLCDTAAEKAMADSIKAGRVRPVTMGDMNRALKEVKPSIGPWLDSARNVATFANNDGRYDDLVAYLKKAKRL